MCVHHHPAGRTFLADAGAGDVYFHCFPFLFEIISVHCKFASALRWGKPPYIVRYPTAIRRILQEGPSTRTWLSFLAVFRR
jgi:hypothetical protein